MSQNQNQSNNSVQSQRTQSNPLSNQNLKQLHEARENLHEQVTIGQIGFRVLLPIGWESGASF